jgi:cobalt/nickel transport system ATP-binding protein
MKTSPTLIELKDICFGYQSGRLVLDHLDFQFHSGDRLGLIAPNGSGKTTLLHLILGLNKPNSGSIVLFGQDAVDAADFKEARRRIGLLFQDPDDQLFSPTVIEDVAFGPLNLGKSREEAIEIARQTLEKLGLEGFEDRVTFKLSGGEKRLVSLATVLAMTPEVLLLDEPLNGLDSDASSRFLEIISDLDISYIMISHDIDFLLSLSTRICTIINGKIVDEDESHIHEHRHLHPHGRYPHEHR